VFAKPSSDDTGVGGGGGQASAQEATAHHPQEECARLQTLQEEQTQIQVARSPLILAAAQVRAGQLFFNLEVLVGC